MDGIGVSDDRDSYRFRFVHPAAGPGAVPVLAAGDYRFPDAAVPCGHLGAAADCLLDSAPVVVPSAPAALVVRDCCHPIGCADLDWS